VILDYQMPEMNGELVAAEMRKTNPRVPILMLSGCESLPENALQLVDEFIAKEDPVESLRLAVQPTVKPVAKSESRYLGISSDKGEGALLSPKTTNLPSTMVCPRAPLLQAAWICHCSQASRKSCEQND